MPLKDWSTTDADNDDADLGSNINWKEQQAPSTVNNSARAMMTQIKRFFDEIAGGTLFVPAGNVAGTSDAITLTTDQAAPYAAGQRYMFIAEGENAGAVTVNRDGEGTRAVKNHGLALAGGEIKTGDVVVIADDGTDYELIYPRRSLPEAVHLISVDTGGASGPILDIYRNSSSPAANDFLGRIDWTAEDSAGNKDFAGRIAAQWLDPASGSEDSRLIFYSTVAGTHGERFALGQGLYGWNSTGGDQGAESINASGVFDDGERLTNHGQVVAIIEDQRTSGTDGGDFASGSDRTRTLNTLVYNRDSVAGLSFNRFTLPAGDWEIWWRAPSYRVEAHQSLLYNFTDSAEVKRGSTEQADSSTGTGHSLSIGIARVSITASKAFEIRHRCSLTNNTDGFGRAASFGTEVYTQVIIRKA